MISQLVSQLVRKNELIVGQKLYIVNNNCVGLGACSRSSRKQKQLQI